MCVNGGTLLHTSHRKLKKWACEVTAAEPSFDAHKPLKWSRTPIVFDTEDHPDRTTAVGYAVVGFANNTQPQGDKDASR